MVAAGQPSSCRACPHASWPTPPPSHPSQRDQTLQSVGVRLPRQRPSAARSCLRLEPPAQREHWPPTGAVRWAIIPCPSRCGRRRRCWCSASCRGWLRRQTGRHRGRGCTPACCDGWQHFSYGEAGGSGPWMTTPWAPRRTAAWRRSLKKRSIVHRSQRRATVRPVKGQHCACAYARRVKLRLGIPTVSRRRMTCVLTL